MKLIQKAIDNHSSCFETGASRLREAIDDEVFVPGVSGMQPTRRAAELAKRGSIVLLKLPYKPITVEVEMVWHQGVTRDPGFRWIREVLSSSTPEFAAHADSKT